MDRGEHAKFVARARRRKRDGQRTDDAKVVGSVIDRMRESLVPFFREPWDNRPPVSDFLTGRRMGKSEYDVRLVFRGAHENPKSTNPLILPTAKQARSALWPLILRVRKEYFPDTRISDVEMRVYLPEGGSVLCGGCEHNEDVGKWFGIPFQEAVIDECGNFKSNPLERLYQDSIKPGTMDFRGRITRSGNPGIALIGTWYTWTGPNRRGNVPLYEGDARVNPYLDPYGGAEAFFEEVLAENGWTRETATFKRLYLGKWAMDLGSLVYPYRAYDDTPNHEPHNYAEALPTETETGDPVDPRFWRYVIGMDIGYVDDTTYVVIASHPAVREQYFVYAEGHSEWTDDQKVERAIQLRNQFGGARLVIDPGGGGKNVLITLAEGKPGRPPVPVELADKPAKAAAIRIVRDELLVGRLRCLPGAQPLVDEWSVLGWDLHKLQHDPNMADHYSDAALYARRASAHHVHDPTRDRPGPEFGTDEWHDMQVAKLFEEAERMEGGDGLFARRGRQRYGGLLQ